VNTEGDASSVAEIRKMITRMFKKLKEDLQKQPNESLENMDKKTQEDTESTK
jgi:hypothetical protein